ncbi:Vma21p [Sporobolomyces salmoneus]|uniref:Vma21p n=1 Tax=Sporobolomyces salmoneus TaxID=183962 RepID=UPI00317DA3DD
MGLVTVLLAFPVVWKLSLFTLLMIVGPIGTYFLSLNHYFHDPTPSAISAAFVANLVLVGFVVVAILEDSGPEHPTTPAAGLGQIGEEKMDAVSREKMRVGKKE